MAAQKAIPRAQEPVQDAPVPDYIPVLRSGQMFTEVDEDTRNEYLDLVASSPADVVAPEAVFGMNGWRRRLAETGADPVTAKRAFDAQWEMMDFTQRRDVVLGNAIDRFYMTGTSEAVYADSMKSASGFANALTAGNGSPEMGMAASDPAVATAMVRRTLFGIDPNSPEGAM